MKKRTSALLAVGMILASLFVAQPASAAGGTWQPYASTWTPPSNWYCGSTASGPALSAQTCTVRSGNYAQSATIVRNRTNSQVIAEARAHLGDGDSPNPVAIAHCTASGVAARGVSVCFSATVRITPGFAWNWAEVPNVSDSLYSPWV